MRRQPPRHPLLLWATRSIVFRSRAQRGAASGGSERPRFTARAVDWVSWLAEVPVEDEDIPARQAAEPEAEASPGSSELLGAASSRSLRVSLKIRHTI
jgi:hypothetical protein